MRISVRPAWLTAVITLAASPLLAVTITFDTIPSVGNPVVPSVVDSGFLFSSGHFHTVDSPAICLFGGCVENGTQYINEEAGGFGLPITMTPVSGAPFSLTGFDGAEVFIGAAAAASGGFPNATHIDLLGVLSGGGIIMTSFLLDAIADGAGGAADFETFLLPVGWTGLASVTFSGSIVGAGAGGISLDNIVASQVPEPGTLLLLGTCLAGVAAFRVRRRR